MDEYKEFLYERSPEYSDVDTGDLSKQKALRERLSCKSFKWFMENVAFDLEKYYPSREPPDFAWGVIQSDYDPDLCVTKGKDPPYELKACIDVDDPPESQYFSLSWRSEIREWDPERCWDVSAVGENAAVSAFECHSLGGNQLWRYDMVIIATINAQLKLFY